jgi:hypothetical protein
LSFGNSTANGVHSLSAVSIANSTSSATMNLSAFATGNTIANASMTTTSVSLANATFAASLGFTGVAVGNSIANSNHSLTSVNISNSIISATMNLSSIYIGNSTVNAIVTPTYSKWSNSTATTYANVTGVAVGANVYMNATTMYVGNSTVNTSISTGLVSVNGAFIANNSGAYHTGVVNASSLSVGTNVIANTLGVYTTGTVNATSFTTTGVTVNTIAVAAGANVYMNATAMFVSTNSTVNTILTTSALTITTNSIYSSSIGIPGVALGNSTVNAALSTSTLTIANSTSNASIAPASLFFGSATTNFNANTTSLAIGSASGNSVLSNNSLTTNNVIFTSNGALTLPVGLQSQRPSSAANGMIRYNSNTGSFEGYANSTWGSIGGSNLTTARQSLTADGTTTLFTITGGYVTGGIDVYRNGLKLVLGTDFTAATGSSINFTTAPATGDSLETVAIQNSTVGNVALVSQTFTANSSVNTTFAVSGGYSACNILVFVNGVKQVNGTDVDVTSGANVTFSTPLRANTVVDVYGYQTFIPANALSKNGDSATGNYFITGNVVVGSVVANGQALSIGTTIANSTTIAIGSLTANSSTLTFGTSNSRIIGDFTNATVLNRLLFQTNATNSSTGIYAVPSGSSGAASWQAANSADPTNSSKILIATNGSTDVQLVSGINGTGTYLPLNILNGGVTRMTIANTGPVTVNTNLTVVGDLVPSSSFKRNKIINGDMRIDQRNAGGYANNLVNYSYTVDRWVLTASQNAKFSAKQNWGAVTPPAGFTNYLGLYVASAVTIGSGDFFFINQRVEGYNMADLGWGTASAKSVTLSFWVYSSLTGTFGAAVQNGTPNYSYSFTYSIPVANTWTYITVTIPGPTSGTWTSDNTMGIQLLFNLGIGSGLYGAANTWVATNTPGVTGAVSVVATAGATFYFTGVQLEQGSSATPFERQIYTDQLKQCQRYFSKSFPTNTAVAHGTGFYGAINVEQYASGHNYLRWDCVSLPAEMRTANPTITFYNPANPTAGAAGYGAAQELAGSSNTWNCTMGERPEYRSNRSFFPLLNGTLQTAGTNGTLTNWSTHWTADTEL